jgi:hypothetical protein
MEKKQAMRGLGDSLAGDWNWLQGFPRGEAMGFLPELEAVVLVSFQIGIRLFDTRSHETVSRITTREEPGNFLLLLS